MNKTVRIGARTIGQGHPCFVIAEAGVNHNGDPDMAGRLVDAAAESGADAVKFQTFDAGALVSSGGRKAAYQVETTGDDESQYEMLRALALPPDSLSELKNRAERLGIHFLSSPFDPGSADVLGDLGVEAMKIASGELTNWILLRHVARFGLPVVLSTGMSTLAEVRRAVACLKEAGAVDIIVMHCVSSYPTLPSQVNLLAMDVLREAFDAPTGFSDHTDDIHVALAAAARGAAVLEKHFTLDRKLPGPDHRFSLEPGRLKELVEKVRDVQAALGDRSKHPMACEMDTKAVSRKSLYLVNELRRGDALGYDDLVALRPEGGISPDQIDRVVGKRLRLDKACGARLSWGDIS